MKNTKITTRIVIFLIIGFLAVIVWGSKNKKDTPQPITNYQMQNKIKTSVSISSSIPIFFYGNTCPHCADVERWMKENDIEEKVQLIKKEVYDNRANALELSKTAKSCGMDTTSIGVPFLFTPEGKCLVGTPDIVNYLSEKAGLSGKETKQ